MSSIKQRIIYLKWEDTVGYPDWQRPAKFYEHLDEAYPSPFHIATIETVGWFISESEDAVVVALNLSTGGGERYGDVQAIPKRCIIKRKWVQI